MSSWEETTDWLRAKTRKNRHALIAAILIAIVRKYIYLSLSWSLIVYWDHQGTDSSRGYCHFTSFLPVEDDFSNVASALIMTRDSNKILLPPRKCAALRCAHLPGVVCDATPAPHNGQKKSQTFLILSVGWFLFVWLIWSLGTRYSNKILLPPG